MMVSSKQSGNDRKRFQLWLAVIVVIVVVLGVLIAVNRHSSKQDASTEHCFSIPVPIRMHSLRTVMTLPPSS